MDIRDCTTDSGALDAASVAVSGGKLIVLPTDTVYGIGADAFNPAAVGNLLAAKGRGRQMPPPVLVGTKETAQALAENLPEGTPEMGAYIQDVALYLSDDCMCPFHHYAKNPGLLTSVIQNAVTDYIKACENPAFFVWEYFNAKRQWGDRYTDDQCWCVALMMTNVRDNGHYVNGFNDRNTQSYKRQRKFIP